MEKEKKMKRIDTSNWIDFPIGDLFNVVKGTRLTKADMVELGLSGGTDSSIRRLAMLKRLNLPEHLSTNAMLQALNLLYTREEFFRHRERRFFRRYRPIFLS